MTEKVTKPQTAEELIESYKKTLMAGQDVQSKSITRSQHVAASVRHHFSSVVSLLLGHFGDTEENRKVLTGYLDPLCRHYALTSYNAIQLVDLATHYLIERNPIDLGSMFLMDNLMRGVNNNAGALHPSILNIVDNETPGANDPRLAFQEIPESKMVNDPYNFKLPVKAETFNAVCYGYFQAYSFQQQAPGGNGNVITFQTTIPGLRLKDSWIPINSVHRWAEVDEADVRNAWINGRSFIAKKIPETVSNNIEQSKEPDNVGNTTSEQEPDVNVPPERHSSDSAE